MAAITAMLVVAGCSRAPEGGSDVGTEGPQPLSVKKDLLSEAAPDASAATPIKVSIPQIAYTYQYAFRLPAAAIAPAQDRHIALCDQLGPERCRVLNMERAISESASGSLTLMVRAGLARSFGRALSAATVQAGGRQTDSSIQAEDLSKQIVDTEARLRAKQALADRLIGLLKTRSGPVADLVAAERAVADVQEEIDAARSWLAEARGRLAMSTFELSYASDGPLGSGFLEPLRRSLGTMTSLFSQSLSFLILLLAAILPWALTGGTALLAWRFIRRRRAIDDAE
ncbi:DUF4349 domain-containing protein [Sphingomonas oleivorans]|nr:DUF4349 domain-containing protein [Sphingomonas oleivorans]